MAVVPEKIYVFRKDELLVTSLTAFALPVQDALVSVEGLELFAPLFERPGGSSFRVGSVANDAALPEGMATLGLRQVAFTWGEERFAEAGYAFSLLAWLRDTRFCGRCGTPMCDSAHERARECPDCGFLRYPPVTPVVIMTVEREGKILLARGPNFPPGRMSVLAGFVEPGESLEDAVRREVAEETGVRVGEVRFFASQPWPFPHSLMVGFRTTATSEAIRIDGKEIVEAGWYAPDAMPDLPPPWSISRKLIEVFLAEQREVGNR